MKRIAYSFFLLLLISCGSSRRPNYHTWVQLQNSTVHDYSLISVRKDELLVSRYTPVFDSSVTVFAIPLSHIIQVRQEHEMTSSGTLVGRAIGYIVQLFGFKKMGDIDYGDEGSLLGHNFDSNRSDYNVGDPHDLLKLKEFSFFPDGEPPELQKIK
jgi:hypothetical protein